MKTIFTLSLFIICNHLIQAQEVIKSHDFDSTLQYRLLDYPNDPSKFICVRQYIDNSNWPEWIVTYNLLEMTPTTSSEMNFPGITEITGEPIEYQGKIVFTARNTANGNELYVFDGQNLQLMDIEIGAGSSDPMFYTTSIINDKLYLIAKKGLYKQAFELNEQFELNQVSEETTNTLLQVVTTNNESVYYACRDTQDSILTVKKYNTNTQLTNSIYSGRGHYAYEATIFNGNILFCTDFNREFSNFCENKLLKINSNDECSILFQDSTMGSYSRFKSFTFLDKYYISINSHSLEATINGTDFYPDIVLNEYEYFEEFITKNNYCHFIIESVWSEHNFVHKFDGVEMTLLQEFDYHCHYVTEKNNTRYYVSIEIASDSLWTRLAQVDLITDQVDLFAITDSSSHPPYFTSAERGATWLGNTLYFIDGNKDGGVESLDIYKLDTDLGILEPDLSDNGFKLYPNPVNGEQLFVETEAENELLILNVEGKIVSRTKTFKGKNSISVKTLEAGTYFVKFGTEVKKLIVF